ncbi:CocE/NonD family hydrolase [Paenibacillus sp. GCM10012306]|uniref:CocE/NonD family hydrolase n=1 Tax=Paenibacillus sp. GCM10012306 TaxID=3317342 RepID=UPI0036144505
MTHTNPSDEFWNSGYWKILKEVPARIIRPIYIGEGWFDHHLSSALQTYEALSPESRMHSVVKIGPWNHFFNPCVEGKECLNMNHSDIQSAFIWFDNILRKKQWPEGKVHYYEIGGNQWLEAPSYPFPSDKTLTYYFSAAAKQQDKSYGLITLEEEHGSELSYIYDPEKPILSHGSESLLKTTKEIGSLKQPECGWRDDVISFLSEPLPEEIRVLGSIKIKLQVSSTAEDICFTAKVIEVRPDGEAYNIRKGITTQAYRNSQTPSRMTYTPQTKVEAVIDLWDITWKFSTGSRIRIDIASSDFPQYSIHTNYPGVWSEQVESKIAEQTLYVGGQSSQVIIPIS